MGGALSAPQYLRSRSAVNDLRALPEIPQNEEVNEVDGDTEGRRDKLKKELDDFKSDLDKKREERKLAVSKISDELNSLRGCKDDLDKERTLREGLEKQVKALKEVTSVSNEMLQLRETQVANLKKRLQEVETSTEESLREFRNRYEQQIENVNKLRRLYEERADAVARGHQSEIERERARYTLLELRMADITDHSPEVERLESKVNELEENQKLNEEELQREKELRCSSAMECKTLTSQLTLINNLFSNLLIGNDLDFDMLTQLLQDNHNLITDLIANGDINETAALLFDIAEKVYKKSEENTQDSTATDAQVALTAKEEIASNLPKVWRVLIELLSRHEDCSNVVQGGSEECYKHVKTPHGSRTVISVSQTFVRLKDLILEKNSLVKEVGRLKTLNGHLENRLDLQEKRLSTVCSELRKTWGVVSKLKVQHRQLHTHEKVLRYELHHKRQMLTDLKHQLKYCRETWDRVREKNTQSEHDWEELRKEFARRKNRDANNSGESGYEDDEASQSPDVSTSESDFDVTEGQSCSPLNDGRSPSLEMEDAASDATVIELIDMLDLDVDDPPQSEPLLDNLPIDDTSSTFHEDVSNDSNLPEDVNVALSISEGTNEAPSLLINTPSTISENTNAASSLAEVTNVTEIDTSEEPSTNLEVAATPEEESSSSSYANVQHRSPEEISSARAERLRRLESQCNSLLSQMMLTSSRSDMLSTRLEQLHEQYGSEERRRSHKNRPALSTSNNEEMASSSTTLETIQKAEEVLESSNSSTRLDEHANERGDAHTSNERGERLQKMETACLHLFDQPGSSVSSNNVIKSPIETTSSQQSTSSEESNSIVPSIETFLESDAVNEVQQSDPNENLE